MKKIVLALVVVLMLSSVLMATSSIKVVTNKDLKTGVYTVEVDGKLILKTDDKDKVIQYLHDPWGWASVNVQYDGYHYETGPDGHDNLVIECHIFALRNDCALYAAPLM